MIAVYSGHTGRNVLSDKSPNEFGGPFILHGGKWPINQGVKSSGLLGEERGGGLIYRTEIEGALEQNTPK